MLANSVRRSYYPRLSQFAHREKSRFSCIRIFPSLSRMALKSLLIYWKLPPTCRHTEGLGNAEQVGGRPVRVVWIIIVAWTALVASAEGLLAEDWPTRPVRIVLGFAAGGSPDFVARALAQKLTEVTGQSFYVENRSGANGNIGADHVAKSAPDGYTLLLAVDTQFSVNPNLDINL